MFRIVHDDGGRTKAGFKNADAGDCVCRSIAIVTGRPYKEIYDRLADGNFSQRTTKRSKKGRRSASDGIHVKRKWFRDYMADLGFEWITCMTIGSGCKVHLHPDELPKEGRYIVVVSKHYTALVDGVLYDTYDPTRDGMRCVYGYWKLAA